MKNLLIYISDGVGCRNFLYSDFIENAEQNGFKVTILKNVLFDFDSKGCKVIDYPKLPIPTYVDMLKTIKVEAEINLFATKFNNPAYRKFILPNRPKRLKERIKQKFKNYKLSKIKTEGDIKTIEDKMYRHAAKSELFKSLCGLLATEKPDVVMFTNQRSVTNIAIELAAKNVGIPTITNIFSWDNLPKGTKIHKSDFYFVWSQYMNDELKSYYPAIRENTIKITGTPQFSSYNDHSDILPRSQFFEQYSLDPNFLYICFSGDDVRTSPHDQIYLDNLCDAVALFNKNEKDIFRVIFRRCPVDNSNRHKAILEKHKAVAKDIAPLWDYAEPNNWQSSYPLKEDTALLKNILFHSALVVNVGSTIAIDASFFGTPAAYLKYQPIESTWKAEVVYGYIHFYTMKGLNPVFWIKQQDDYRETLNAVLDGDIKETIEDAQKWAQKIIMHPIDQVLDRLWGEVKQIANK